MGLISQEGSRFDCSPGLFTWMTSGIAAEGVNRIMTLIRVIVRRGFFGEVDV